MSRVRDEKGPLDSLGLDWEGTRLYHLTRCLDATPSQRLAWLEEMLELLVRTGAFDRAHDRDS